MSTFEKLSLKEKYSYVFAGFGQVMVITFVTTFMLHYLYDIIGFTVAGVAALTTIIFFARIWDAITDPMMGIIVDRTRTRWGKLRPYILFTAFPVALLTVLMYSVPDISETGKLIYFGIVYFLWGTIYTMCDVPFWGLAGSLSSDTQERSSVISLTRAFGAISTGIIIILGIPLAKGLSFSGDATPEGWQRAAIIISILGMSLFLLAFFNTKERAKSSQEVKSLKDMFKVIIKNKPLFLILLGGILNFGQNIIQVGGAVVAVIIFGDEDKFMILGGVLITALFIATMIAPIILKKMSKRNMMIYANLMTFMMYILMFFIGYESFIVIMIFLFFIGMGSGFFIVSQTGMIADSVDYLEYVSGERNEGICFSGLTFVGKLMGALASTVFGTAIAFVGYTKDIEVTPYMQSGIFFTITIIPAISCLLGIIPYLYYKLSEDRLNEMMKEVLIKRQENE